MVGKHSDEQEKLQAEPSRLKHEQWWECGDGDRITATYIRPLRRHYCYETNSECDHSGSDMKSKYDISYHLPC